MIGELMRCYICENEASLTGKTVKSQVERISCPICGAYRVGDSFRDFYKAPLTKQTRIKIQNLIKNHPNILLESRHLG